MSDGRAQPARDRRRVAELRALGGIMFATSNRLFRDAAGHEFYRVLQLWIADAPEDTGRTGGVLSDDQRLYP